MQQLPENSIINTVMMKGIAC